MCDNNIAPVVGMKFKYNGLNRKVHQVFSNVIQTIDDNNIIRSLHIDDFITFIKYGYITDIEYPANPVIDIKDVGKVCCDDKNNTITPAVGMTYKYGEHLRTIVGVNDKYYCFVDTNGVSYTCELDLFNLNIKYRYITDIVCPNTNIVCSDVKVEKKSENMTPEVGMKFKFKGAPRIVVNVSRRDSTPTFCFIDCENVDFIYSFNWFVERVISGEITDIVLPVNKTNDTLLIVPGMTYTYKQHHAKYEVIDIFNDNKDMKSKFYESCPQIVSESIKYFVDMYELGYIQDIKYPNSLFGINDKDEEVKLLIEKNSQLEKEVAALKEKINSVIEGLK